MNTKITILNVLKYEKEGRKGTRIAIIFPDKNNIQSRDSFKGFADISVYYDNHDVFNAIPVDIIGRECEAILEEKVNPNNPLRRSTVIKSISCNGKEYKLC